MRNSDPKHNYVGIEFSEPPTRCADQNCAMVKEVIGCALHDFRMTTAAKRIFLLKVATFAAELMEAYRPIPENEGGEGGQGLDGLQS